nr:unnamed protein product [Timema monikensis]
MQWVFYLLAQHPQVQDRLYEELKGIEGADNVTQLHLLKGVMREALRLYPVAPFLTRFLPQDCVLGGYKISSGQLIVMSLYTSGRDGKHFPEPDVFKPERWCRNEAGTYRGVGSPYAYLPFAMGARSCVGRKIAETQILLTLAEVVKRFKLSLVDSQPVEMVLELVAVPSRPITLHLTKRWQ